MFKRNEHEVVLSKIIYAIYANKKLAPLLGFKGGTACYLFYKLPRFSVDLDFNLIDLKQKDFVFEELEKIIKNFGTIKDKAEKRNTLFFLLSYRRDAQQIKTEVSLRNFAEDKYEIKNYLGLSIPTMTKDCLTAYKLVAILGRKKPAMRDLFDAHFFLKNDWPINEKIILAQTGKKKDQYFKKIIKFLEKNKKINILQGLGELVDQKQKRWIKEELIKELIYLLKIYSK